MMKLDAIVLLQKYGPKNPYGLSLLLSHSEAVTRAALQISNRLENAEIDTQFLEEAAMIHDIGIAFTDAPSIGCFGTESYMAHGIIGAEILRNLGFPRHAHVCESHIGVGLTKKEILTAQIPLPPRDYLPVSIEERIICYADNFFSKGVPEPLCPTNVDVVRKKIAGFGNRSLETFDRWHAEFGSVG